MIDTQKLIAAVDSLKANQAIHDGGVHAVELPAFPGAQMAMVNLVGADESHLMAVANAVRADLYLADHVVVVGGIQALFMPTHWQAS